MVDPELRERFRALFSGSQGAYGCWDPSATDKESAHFTKKEPTPESAWDEHLAGTFGLGQVPARSDGTCVFGAIDVDRKKDSDEPIDLTAVSKRIAELGIPLIALRSKSEKGAHLALFMEEPGQSAEYVRSYLARCAAALGYPSKTEIFPKQPRTGKDNFGQWINLPYFNAEHTTRFAVTAEGTPLTFPQFLDYVVRWPHGKPLPEPVFQPATTGMEGIPPCLEALLADGSLGTGARNNGLFNLGVYFRKSMGEGWEERVGQANYSLLQPPLSLQEVQSVVKSLRAKHYEYLCTQEPIVAVCQKAICLTRKYGVGRVTDATYEFQPLELGQLKKFDMVEQPIWYLTVNGFEIEFDTKTLRMYAAFRDRVWEATQLWLAPVKQLDWEAKLQTLVPNMTKLEAPKDASIDGQVQELIFDFLKRKDQSETRQDVLRHKPYLDPERGEIMFRGSDLVDFIKKRKIIITSQKLFTIFSRLGGGSRQVSILNHQMRCWTLGLIHYPVTTEPLEKKEPPPSEF